MLNRYSLSTGAVLLLAASQASAVSPAEFLQQFQTEARQTDPAFSGFSSDRGEQFFKATHGSEWSCASCHTANPLRPGEHARTGKHIDPLAPAINPERFTSARQVEKWYRRNCNDVLGRECTALEKGDVLTYLLSLKL